MKICDAIFFHTWELTNNKSINPYACKDLAIKMKNTKKQYIKINPVLQLKIVYYHRVVVTLKTVIILIIFFSG